MPKWDERLLNGPISYKKPDDSHETSEQVARQYYTIIISIEIVQLCIVALEKQWWWHRIMFLFRLEFTQQSRVIGNIFLLIQYKATGRYGTGLLVDHAQVNYRLEICIIRYYDNKADNFHVRPTARKEFFFSLQFTFYLQFT